MNASNSDFNKKLEEIALALNVSFQEVEKGYRIFKELIKESDKSVIADFIAITREIERQELPVAMKIFIALKIGLEFGSEPSPESYLRLAVSEELYSFGKNLGIPEEQWRQLLRGIRRIH